MQLRHKPHADFVRVGQFQVHKRIDCRMGAIASPRTTGSVDRPVEVFPGFRRATFAQIRLGRVQLLANALADAVGFFAFMRGALTQKLLRGQLILQFAHLLGGLRAKACIAQTLEQQHIDRPARDAHDGNHRHRRGRRRIGRSGAQREQHQAQLACGKQQAEQAAPPNDTVQLALAKRRND